MNRTCTFLFLVIVVGLMSGCGDHGHSHDEAGGHSHDDHGHSHDQPADAAHGDHGHPHDQPDADTHDDHGHSHDQPEADDHGNPHDEPGSDDHGHSHDEPDADAADDHGHPHDEADGHAHDESPTVAVTHWTDRSELFMEYPVFVAGESGRSAIHVTDLADFSPLSEGEAVVVLRGEDGRVLEFRDGPSRPGIFDVDLRVDWAGVYEMSLRVEAPPR